MNFTRGNINIGLKETIRVHAAASGLFKEKHGEDLEDIDLLKYACAASQQEWFAWLLDNCSFYNKRGNIRKELRSGFDESLVLAIGNDHIEQAQKLFALGARAKYMINSLLYRSIMKGRHDMAELLFANGASIKQQYHLAECMAAADDRMKKIIRQGILDTINRRFRT